MAGELLGVFFILFSVIWFVLGVYGLMRFPDVYTRIHASGKLATLGIVSLLAGTAFLAPETTLKMIALGIFLIITQPVASHVVASAAHRSGVTVVGAQRDDLRAIRSTGPADVLPGENPAGPQEDTAAAPGN